MKPILFLLALVAFIAADPGAELLLGAPLLGAAPLAAWNVPFAQAWTVPLKGGIGTGFVSGSNTGFQAASATGGGIATGFATGTGLKGPVGGTVIW